jgi:protease I
MAGILKGKTVAILATDGFEEAELAEPKKALDKADATIHVIAPHSGEIKGWDKTDWGRHARVDRELSEASVNDYDALMLPGGVISPDKLRMDSRAVAFVRHFFETGKPVAAICHGPWILAEADVVRGRMLTSWPSLQTDLRNAGANWVDEQVVVDGNLITSRKPEDLPAFNQTMIERFARASTPMSKTA